MAGTTILLADDEATLRENLERVLKEEGFDVIACPDGRAALTALESASVDAIITDLRMPGLSGMELIDHAGRLAPDAGIIVITAFGQVETAVEAMRKGAEDYICKPLAFDELIFKLKRLLAHTGLAKENRFLRDQLRQTAAIDKLVGNALSIHDVRETIRRATHTFSNVLICGESGTGKEVVARALHYTGITKDKPFVAVNCGGLVDTLVESELFGYRAGSFTGADTDHIGYFEAADGGTLFLDEITNLPMAGQAVLLRAIEQKAITRVGDHRSRPVKLRIIAATNRDLEQAIRDGVFREDLYYRLNVLRITLPPLRNRLEDLPLLVDHFVKRYDAEINCRCPGFDETAMQVLARHDWPGNIRELENVVERALIFSGDRTVTAQDISIGAGKAPAPPASDAIQTDNLREAVHRFEREHIRRVMMTCNGNRIATARKLGIGLSSLYRKMDELGIEKQRIKSAR
ncbi:MAG: sigma-54-dependent transcriptional regulator [Phycisphaerae bacterium]